VVVRLMSSVEMDDLQSSFNHHGDPAPKLGRWGKSASSTVVKPVAKSEGGQSDDNEGVTSSKVYSRFAPETLSLAGRFDN